MFKVDVLKGRVENVRLASLDAASDLRKASFGRVKAPKFDLSKSCYTFELEGKTVVMAYTGTQRVHALHIVVVAGEYSRNGTLVVSGLKNLTTGFFMDPRDEFMPFGRILGGFPLLLAFCIWQISSGISDPIILAIIWFVAVFVVIVGVCLAWFYLFLVTVLNAINAQVAATN
jgi:hypothetical protein